MVGSGPNREESVGS